MNTPLPLRDRLRDVLEDLHRRPLQAALRERQLEPGRWIVVEEVDVDGTRFAVVERAMPPSTAGLTRRERDALRKAALGLTNKVIAFELGISSSTVGVLLHRAARKLGAHTRGELLAAFGETAS